MEALKIVEFIESTGQQTFLVEFESPSWCNPGEYLNVYAHSMIDRDQVECMVEWLNKWLEATESK